jgi:hypothetical protein
MIEELIKRKEEQLAKNNYLEFTAEELSTLNKQDALNVEKYFHGYALMRLPESEQKFFEWLKKVDLVVWEDLWSEEDDPYFVSIDFLHHFTGQGNGFPICDLVEVENYWFTEKHIKPKGLEKFEQIDQKIEEKKLLSISEALLCEIIKSSIDIWHFCHRYRIPLEAAKKEVLNMHKDDLLVHLPNRNDLVKYLDNYPVKLYLLTLLLLAD